MLKIYLVGFLNVFFLGSLVEVSLSITPQLAPSKVLNGLLDYLLGMNIWCFFIGSLVEVSLGMSHRLAPSEVLLGGLLFQSYRLGISLPPCVNLLV